jgi:hypothetical protein
MSGISMFLDDVFSFFAFKFFGINGGTVYLLFLGLYISNAEEDLAVTILKSIGEATLTAENQT